MSLDIDCFSVLKRLFFLAVFIPAVSYGELQLATSGKLMVDVVLYDAKEVNDLLNKIAVYSEGRPEMAVNYPPIVLMLHGPEINLFQKTAYSDNKSLVDLAAKLDALGIIDMRVCQTVSTFLGLAPESFPAFVELVPYAGDEIDRLRAKGYTWF